MRGSSRGKVLVRSGDEKGLGALSPRRAVTRGGGLRKEGSTEKGDGNGEVLGELW